MSKQLKRDREEIWQVYAQNNDYTAGRVADNDHHVRKTRRCGIHTHTSLQNADTEKKAKQRSHSASESALSAADAGARLGWSVNC